jgi:hypothetical protein
MRAGVSCAVVVVLLLSTLPISPVFFDDDGIGSAAPILNPDKRLEVNNNRIVNGYEVWREVVVRSLGYLLITDGGKLVTDRVVLEGNAMLAVRGGVLEVSPTSHKEEAMIKGQCSWFEVSDNSVLRILGPDGGYDIPTSMGCSVGINVSASRYIQVTDSTLNIRAGDGFSPPETMTSDDLTGRAFAGGDVELTLIQESPYDILWVSGNYIRLQAGTGGKAPDAERPPSDPSGRVKGLGGGYTNGGSVGGLVGAGGDVNIYLNGARVEVSNTDLNVTAGKGGSAGDAADVPNGIQAGGGGGGYSGGDGASGQNLVDTAVPGGDITGEVGRGGDIDLVIKSGEVDLRTAGFGLIAGDGGDAGDGASTVGLGGGGGGGYTGGGGGSYWHMAGANGGTVNGPVGRGGNVDVEVISYDDMEIKSCRFWLYAGRGGDAGDGGDGSNHGGGGGGGYSGGGGGGGGETGGLGPGNAGGPGGDVDGLVGRGGNARFRIQSSRLIELGTLFDVEAGWGGHSGFPGRTHFPSSGGTAGGGGGGGHTAGGGGGAGHSGQATGEAGGPGTISGPVGDGGDTSFIITSDRPSIHRNTIVYTKWGQRGSLVNATGSGTTAGRGAYRQTLDGSMYEVIPRSEPMLYIPADEDHLPQPPKFDWMPVFRSSTDGDVDHYLFELDDENNFETPVKVLELDQPGLATPNLPMGTYYWRVTAIYYGPPSKPGPTPPFFWFRYFNAPPVVTKEPTVSCDEGLPTSIYIGNYVHDPDTSLQALCLTCEHPGVQSIMGLFMMLYYANWQPNHQVKYNVSDGTSTVQGIINVVVIDANERPEIHSIGSFKPPVLIVLEEGEEVYLDVNVTDPNNDKLTFKVLGTWQGANISKRGTLHLTGRAEDIGMHVISVVADDGKGGVDTMKVRVNVVNQKEPPESPEVFGPKNNSRWKEGKDITFTVKVSDPDIVHGEVLTVTWISNVSGQLATMGTTEMATFTTSSLPVGKHHITIIIDDGKYQKREWLDITVLDVEDPSPPPDTSTLWMYILFGIVFLLMIAIGYVAGTRGARNEMER